MDGHDGQEAQQQPASDDSNIGAAEVVLSSDESGTVPEEKVTHPEFNAPKSQALHRVSKPREILARNRKSLWAVLGVIVILLAVIVGLWVRVVIKHPTGSSSNKTIIPTASIATETINTKSQQASITAKQAVISTDQIPTTSSSTYAPQAMPINGSQIYMQTFAPNTTNECEILTITVTVTITNSVAIPTTISIPSLSTPAPTTCPDANNTFYSTFQNGTLQTFRRICGIKLSKDLRIPEYFGDVITNSLDGCFDGCASLNTATNIPCMAIQWEYARGGYSCSRYSGVLKLWDSTDKSLTGGILVALKPFN